MHTRLEVNALDKSFGARVIFQHWTHRFEAGFHGVTGPNGVGKSTLLAIVAGAEPYQDGEIILNGERLGDEPDRYRPGIGYCPDRLDFYPFLKVSEFWHIAASVKSAETPRQSHPLVSGFNLGVELNKRLDELSLGTRKKVLLVAALINDPALLLLDEPTDELDSTSAGLLVDYLSQRREAITIFSTHDDGLLADLAAARLKLGNDG